MNGESGPERASSVEPREKLDILYRDPYLVAVYKPAGLLVHRTSLDSREVRFAVQLLRDQLGKEVFPCHRLDKPTSGILLFALNKEILKAVNAAFAEGRVEKRYRALVRGWIREAGRLDYPLRPLKEEGSRAATAGPRDAVTEYAPLEHYELPEALGRYATARFSLVELAPLTGRTHQLRRHLAHLRHPVIGDTRHGDGLQNRFFRDRLQSRRLLLSAVSLAMAHPVSGRELRVEAEPDTGFQSVVERLRCQGAKAGVSRPPLTPEPGAATREASRWSRECRVWSGGDPEAPCAGQRPGKHSAGNRR